MAGYTEPRTSDGMGNEFPGSEPIRFGAGDAHPKSFTWFESYTEAMLELESRDEQYRFVMGVIGYAAYGTSPDFTEPALRPLFAVIKPIIDSAAKRSEGGKKGGRPRKEQGGNEG